MNKIRIVLSTGLITTLALPMAGFAYFPEDVGATSAERPTRAERVMSATDTDTTNDTDTSMATSTNANAGIDFLAPFVDNESSGNGLSTTFDVRAFRSHPCFNAVGEEQEFCLRSLGITSDFEELAGSDLLGQSIVQYTLNQRCQEMTGEDYTDCLADNKTMLPQLMAQFSMDATLSQSGATTVNDATATDETDIRMTRQQRAQRLWELCESHDLGQAGCFQQFIRSLTDDTVAMSEIEALFGKTSAPSTTTNDDDADENVLSETTEEESLPETMDERGEWLWDLCAEMGTDQSVCYRAHYRMTANWKDDALSLEEIIKS